MVRNILEPFSKHITKFQDEIDKYYIKQEQEGKKEVQDHLITLRKQGDRKVNNKEKGFYKE